MSPHTSSRRRFVRAVGIGGLAVSATGIASAQNKPENFRTHLAGGNEVPPAETNAQGQAKFQLNKDEDELDYKLIVANIEDVLKAHIHVGAPDVNGPVVVWLYPKDGPPEALIPGRFNGVLAETTIRSENLVGPLSGLGLDDLIDEIKAGNTYVNVHTKEFPGGEIRGQIR